MRPGKKSKVILSQRTKRGEDLDAFIEQHLEKIEKSGKPLRKSHQLKKADKQEPAAQPKTMMRLDTNENASKLEESKRQKPVGIKKLGNDDSRKKPPTPEPDEIYEEDFDNFSDEEQKPPPPPQPKHRKRPSQDSAVDFSMDEIKKAVAAENAAAIKKEFPEDAKKQTYLPAKVKSTFSLGSKVLERQDKRTKDLIDLVEREVESFNLFDMFPLTPFEKQASRLNSKAIKNSAVQSNEDNIEREVQTLEQDLVDKSAQWPDDMGVVKQSNTAPASLSK